MTGQIDKYLGGNAVAKRANRIKIGDTNHPFLSSDSQYTDNLHDLWKNHQGVRKKIFNLRSHYRNNPTQYQKNSETDQFVLNGKGDAFIGAPTTLIDGIMTGKHAPSVEECEMIARDFGLTGERHQKFMAYGESYREDFAKRQETAQATASTHVEAVTQAAETAYKTELQKVLQELVLSNRSVDKVSKRLHMLPPGKHEITQPGSTRKTPLETVAFTGNVARLSFNCSQQAAGMLSGSYPKLPVGKRNKDIEHLDHMLGQLEFTGDRTPLYAAYDATVAALTAKGEGFAGKAATEKDGKSTEVGG